MLNLSMKYITKHHDMTHVYIILKVNNYLDKVDKVLEGGVQVSLFAQGDNLLKIKNFF